MRKTWITGLCGLVLLTGLSACGPMNENNGAAGIARGLLGRLTGNSGAAESTASVDSSQAAQSTVLTRNFIEDFDGPLLRISVISLDATGVVYRVAENGSKVTWISDESFTFTFDKGLIVGTRGFGFDLMGSDISGAVQSLRAGGSHLRTLDFLNGVSQIERLTYQCQTVQTGRETITIFERNYATSVFKETCTGENGAFENTYWRGANGVIWQSRQWISEGAGYIGYQRL